MVLSSTRGLALLFVPLLAVPVLAGKLEKAFTALEIKNYFLARELFQGQVEKHPAAAWYGLSVITGRADNPFYQLDSSYVFVQRSEAAFGIAPEKERMSIALSGVTAAAIKVQQEHIYGIAWEATQAENTAEAYARYIGRYPRSAQYNEAVEQRDRLEFLTARGTNTAQAYQAFIDAYPQARQIYEARSRMQEAVFREAAPQGTEEEYARFIHDHPESPYVRNAEDSIYSRAVPRRAPVELHRFILKYPANANVPEAWRALYALSTKELSANSITGFLQEYPDYPFINELAEDYKTASLMLYPFRQNGLWGFIDDSGVERIKASYEFVEPFINGQAQVGMAGKVGTINKGGKEVVPIVYDDVLDAHDGFSTVEQGEKSGVVDRTGRLIIRMTYGEVGEFEDGLAYAERDGLYGYIDVSGATVIPFSFEAALGFRNGSAVVKKEGSYGVIDKKGEVIVPFQYDWIEGFATRVSRVRKAGRMGLIGPFGDAVLPAEHEHVGPFNDGLALVIDKGRCGYVDGQGTWIVPQQFEANEGTPSIGDFHNGVARVLVSGKFGLIDTRGERVFPPQYVDIGLLESGIVPVKKRTKWGYASRAFATLVDAKYDQAWEFRGGYARVRSGDLFGLIDSTGREVIAPTFRKLGDVQGGSLVATAPTGTGIVDLTGKPVIPLAYTNAERSDDHIARVERNGHFAYARLSTGQFIWKETGFDAPNVAPEKGSTQ